MTFKKWLLDNEACENAVDWVGGRTLEQAWEDCEQADWMLWLITKNAGKRGWPSRKQVVLAACLCAETALQYTDDPRAREAIEVTKRWVAGKATLDEVRVAAEAAVYAADTAWAYTAYAARNAAWAALDAAYAAVYADWATRAAVYAARAASNAARAAAYADAAVDATRASNRAAWATSHKQMCKIVRENLSVGELS